MRQHLSHYSARQVPYVSGPDSLCLKAFYYLAEYGLYSIPNPAQPATPLRRRIKASLLVGGKHIKPPHAELLPQFGFPVGAITYAVAFSLCGKFFDHRQVAQIGGSHNYSSYYSGPAHSHVKAKAIIGLLYSMVLAVVSFTSKAFTSFSASKLAYGHREAIYDSKALVTVGLIDEFLPKSFFQLPQIGCLPDESSAMNESQSGEEMGVVTAEVVEQSLILGQPKILADDFGGEDFAISEPGPRPTLAEALVAKEAVEGIVNEAKHSYNEGIQVQGERPPIDGLAITIENASPWTFNFNLKTCTSRY